MVPRIAVVGLGKLGSCMAAVFADAGFPTVGADIDAHAVYAVHRHEPPPNVNEPGLADLLGSQRVRGNLSATSIVADAAARADIVFIVVPTPSNPDDRFDASMVCAVVEQVCVGLRWRERVATPVVVVTSTVMPGTCASTVAGVITDAGYTIGEDIGLLYSPEFIALGSVLHDLRNPDVVYVGSDHDWSADVLSAVYEIVAPEAPQQRLSLVDAEVAKLATNVFLSVKIGYGNEVARLCESIDGADGSAVCAALGADSRIGSKYLTPGGIAGGPCLPRDTRAWSALSRWCGRDPSRFADAAQHADGDVLEWVYETVEAHEPSKDPVVGVLGLSYKPGTQVTADSMGWTVAEMLGRSGARFVAVHDPVVEHVPLGCHRLPDLVDTIEAAQVVVVATDHPEYRGLGPPAGATWVDVWGICGPGDGVLIRPGISTNG